MSASPNLASLVQYFFTQHLCEHKRSSPKTVIAYRDTFRLLLNFLQARTGRAPTRLTVADFDAPAILAFLDHLETARHNQIRSRNVRLGAIRSFFHLVAARDPANLVIANRVLAIPVKRTDRRLVTYLTRVEMDAVLAAPDPATWLGRRDHALLLTMYNSGARASEILGLRCGQVSLETNSTIQLHGKGRKERTVPLWPLTARVLQRWFHELNATLDSLAFRTVRGAMLSADGLNHLLQRAVRRASTNWPSLLAKRVTPHVLRHTTGVHLLQSGVDIAVIALWLGHESTETTHGYIEADLASKQKALEKLTPAQGKLERFQPKDELLRFLAGL
jgi:integrase/recombinase XerD